MNKCINCEQETKNAKFCSRSCSVSYNNSKTPKRTKNENNIKCIGCDNIFYRAPNSAINQIYCSRSCRSKHRFETGQCRHPSTIKPILIELYGNKCSICHQGSQWKDQDLVMILDHIDGNSSNNMPDNLRLVCPNCDSQLPTYKAKNKGNGRHKRRQRYADGKSY